MWNKLERQGMAVLECLEKAGHEAYFVGGYVRDKQLSRPVKDIDIATSARPEQVVALFQRTIPTGLAHGTVTVMWEGSPFEVTTFRTESEYKDFRRPSEVQFISELEEDLRRRDFTMNAMAMDRHGQLRDPFGGQHDLEQKLLRCVGDPEERFQEDALRMMRCVRFASVYGLEIDRTTWDAVLRKRELLRHVAMERVRAELERMLAGPWPNRGWRLLLDSGLLRFFKEPLDWAWGARSASDLTPAMQALDKLREPLHRWMLILAEGGTEPNAARALLRSLTFSVKDLERIAKALEVRAATPIIANPECSSMDGLPDCTSSDKWKLTALRFGDEAMKDWLEVIRAVRESEGLDADTAPDYVNDGITWLEQMPVTSVKELAVSGQTLIRHSGQAAGPWVSQTLQQLLRLAALGRLPNTEEALLKAAILS